MQTDVPSNATAAKARTRTAPIVAGALLLVAAAIGAAVYVVNQRTEARALAATESLTQPEADPETVIKTKPLAIAKSDRRKLVEVYPIDGPTIWVEGGTRVERLARRAAHKQPQLGPNCDAPGADCAWGVIRILEGEYKGVVGLVVDDNIRLAL